MAAVASGRESAAIICNFAIMSVLEPDPRDVARAFTPKLAELVDDPLFSDVWADPALSPRDRSLATVAVLVALYRPEQLPAHFRRARDNGVTRGELAALITHVAFYAGFPAAISASGIAARTLVDEHVETLPNQTP